MDLVEILMAIGGRSRIGLASLFSVEDVEFLMRFWDRNVGYIITKTMMDFNYRLGEKSQRRREWTVDGQTLFHSGTTCNESPDFHYGHEVIEHKLNDLINKGVAVIPSIGSKDIGTDTWANMQRYLPSQRIPIIEINFRYTFRSLVQKYKEDVVGNKLVNCDEYGADYPNGIPNLSEIEKVHIRKSVNYDFKIILGAVRDIFPPDQYCLIAKLWSNPDIRTHLAHMTENHFDSVTLVNSIKAMSPKDFEHLPKRKISQMSGLGLRSYREEDLLIARDMQYGIPIFVSGGVGIEAASRHNPSIQEGIRDIIRCFNLGADYAQLGIVAYRGGPDTVAAIMRELGPRYRLDAYQDLRKAA